MRCLFCKQDSSDAKSIEHIIPESFGNHDFVLPRGFICDKCNNYFAHDVEKPFLDQFYMRLLRFQELVPNKKGRIPSINGIIGSEPVTINRRIRQGEICTDITVSSSLFHQLLNGKDKIELIIPAFNDNYLPPQDIITSRFIAKMALEALSVRIRNNSEWLNYLIDEQQFDPIREHARYGTTKYWPCNIRRIYKTDKKWKFDNNEESYQVVHESDFLFPNITDDMLKQESCVYSELYFIIALWGIEFAINIGGPNVEGYQKWLADHNGASPLYEGKNSSDNTLHRV